MGEGKGWAVLGSVWRRGSKMVPHLGAVRAGASGARSPLLSRRCGLGADDGNDGSS